MLRRTTMLDLISATLLAGGVLAAAAVWGIHFRNLAHFTVVEAALQAPGRTALTRLVDEGLDPDAVLRVDSPANGFRLLAIAAGEGRVDLVESLLDAGADVHALSIDQRSALAEAANDNHSTTMRLLLQRGADPSFPRSRPPILAAVEGNATQAIKILADAGADLDAVNEYGWTALSAAGTRRARLEVVAILLELGADPNGVEGENAPPIVAAVDSAVRNRDPVHVERVRLLLEHGADPNRMEGRSQPMVFDAVGHIELLQLLLEHGADPNTVDWYSRTALYVAAQSGPAEAVEALLAAGADPNAIDAKALKRYRYPEMLEMVRLRRDADGPIIEAMLLEAMGLEPDADP